MKAGAPFVYSGGKSRRAAEVWERFGGDVDVYVEPFAGSLAVLLQAPAPAGREIICDKESLISNFWRAMRHDPEAVAYHADWPPYHDDLTARRRRVALWREENKHKVAEDDEFYDPMIAGYYAWCLSNWIGGAGNCFVLKTAQIPSASTSQGVQQQADRMAEEKRPQMPGVASGQGVQQQRPHIGDKPAGQGVQQQRPHIGGRPAAQGVQQQRVATNGIPKPNHVIGGQGVQQQRLTGDGIPMMPGGSSPVGGQGVTQNRKRVADGIPKATTMVGGAGVQQQRAGRDAPPMATDGIPMTRGGSGPASGQGVQQQRQQLTSDKIPKSVPNGCDVGRVELPQRIATEGILKPVPNGVDVGRRSVPSTAGRRVQQFTDSIPLCREGGGRGVTQQRVDLDHGPEPEPCDGSRLLPWFRELQERLRKVIVLNRDWRSAVTPSVLCDTPTARGYVRAIFLDPPYLLAERGTELYASDIDGTTEDAARDSYEWAVKHGERYRIAYCAHGGDFPVPDGWTYSIRALAGIRDPERRAKSTGDIIMYSPCCVGQNKLF